MYTLEHLLNSLDCSFEVYGSREVCAADFCSLFEQIPNGITWIRTNSPATHALLVGSSVSVVICPRLDFPKPTPAGIAYVLVDRPQLRYLRLMKRMSSRCEPADRSIHPTATISGKARLGKNVTIGPFAQIGECEVGNDVVIKSHAIIHWGVRLGNRVLVSEFANIGGHGFSHIRNEHGRLENMPHIGTVVLEDDVEIFPYTNVDRGTLGTTKIGQGTKVDHYCHIGHNAKIGADSVITANVTTAGGVVIGDQCLIGVGSRFRDGVRVGDRVTIGMSSTVTRDVPDGETWLGTPAMEIEAFKLLQQRLRH